MNVTNYDFIVLGLGGVGSATLYQLAAAGYRCLGIEQFGLVHDRGSSHGQTRIIRKAYFEHEDYVPLLLRAYELWSELEQRTNRTLFHRIGLAQFGPPGGSIIRGIDASVAAHQLPIERPTVAEFTGQHPLFHLTEETAIRFEPDAGALLVEQCVQAALDAARSLGASIETNCPVDSISTPGESVEVYAGQRRFSADRLIITAGAWSADLLDVTVPLRVIRKHMHWYDVGQRLSVPKTPAFFFDMPNGYFYGMPAMEGEGMKLAEHSGGEELSLPANGRVSECPEDRRRVDEFLRTVFPALTASKSHHLRHQPCMYTLSPDEHFIVDRHPRHSQIVFAAGLSGHGFKFAPVLAQLLIELATVGQTVLPSGFLRLSRFATTG